MTQTLSLDRMLEMSRLSSQLLTASSDLLKSILAVARRASDDTHQLIVTMESYQPGSSPRTCGAALTDEEHVHNGCVEVRRVALSLARCNVEIGSLLGSRNQPGLNYPPRGSANALPLITLQALMRALGTQAAGIAATYSTTQVEAAHRADIEICAAGITRMLHAISKNISVAEQAALATARLHCQTVGYLRRLQSASR